MNGVSIQLGLKDLQVAIQRMASADRARLLRALEESTWWERYRDLLRRIDKRLKRYPISRKDIRQACEEVRQELYETRYRHQHLH